MQTPVARFDDSRLLLLDAEWLFIWGHVWIHGQHHERDC